MMMKAANDKGKRSFLVNGQMTGSFHNIIENTNNNNNFENNANTNNHSFNAMEIELREDLQSILELYNEQQLLKEDYQECCFFESKLSSYYEILSTGEVQYSIQSCREVKETYDNEIRKLRAVEEQFISNLQFDVFHQANLQMSIFLNGEVANIIKKTDRLLKESSSTLEYYEAISERLEEQKDIHERQIKVLNVFQSIYGKVTDYQSNNGSSRSSNSPQIVGNQLRVIGVLIRDINIAIVLQQQLRFFSIPFNSIDLIGKLQESLVISQKNDNNNTNNNNANNAAVVVTAASPLADSANSNTFNPSLSLTEIVNKIISIRDIVTDLNRQSLNSPRDYLQQICSSLQNSLTHMLQFLQLLEQSQTNKSSYLLARQNLINSINHIDSHLSHVNTNFAMTVIKLDKIFNYYQANTNYGNIPGSNASLIYQNGINNNNNNPGVGGVNYLNALNGSQVQMSQQNVGGLRTLRRINTYMSNLPINANYMSLNTNSNIPFIRNGSFTSEAFLNDSFASPSHKIAMKQQQQQQQQAQLSSNIPLGSSAVSHKRKNSEFSKAVAAMNSLPPRIAITNSSPLMIQKDKLTASNSLPNANGILTINTNIYDNPSNNEHQKDSIEGEQQSNSKTSFTPSKKSIYCKTSFHSSQGKKRRKMKQQQQQSNVVNLQQQQKDQIIQIVSQQQQQQQQLLKVKLNTPPNLSRRNSPSISMMQSSQLSGKSSKKSSLNSLSKSRLSPLTPNKPHEQLDLITNVEDESEEDRSGSRSDGDEEEDDEQDNSASEKLNKYRFQSRSQFNINQNRQQQNQLDNRYTFNEHSEDDDDDNDVFRFDEDESEEESKEEEQGFRTGNLEFQNNAKVEQSPEKRYLKISVEAEQPHYEDDDVFLISCANEEDEDDDG